MLDLINVMNFGGWILMNIIISVPWINVMNFGGWILLEHLLLQCAIDSYDEHRGWTLPLYFVIYIYAC